MRMNKSDFMSAMERLDVMEILAHEIAEKIKDYNLENLSVDDVASFYNVDVRVARLALMML